MSGRTHREGVDLSALAGGVAAELQETQPERQVEFVIAEGLVVKGDARLLRVMLENLLGNAWKFTGKNARARIELGYILPSSRKRYGSWDCIGFLNITSPQKRG